MCGSHFNLRITCGLAFYIPNLNFVSQFSQYYTLRFIAAFFSNPFNYGMWYRFRLLRNLSVSVF